MQSTVTFKKKEYRCVNEGLAYILSPSDGKEVKKTRTGGEEQSVFHNPIQTFNRDLSVLAAKVHAEDVAAARLAHHKYKRTKSKPSKTPSAKRKRDDEAENASTEVPPDSKKAKTDEPSIVAALNADSQSEVPTDSQPAEGSTAAPANNSAAQKPAKPKSNKPPHEQFRILDALSATGLRALRYAQEIEEATLITANDLSAEAVEAIKRNVEYNETEDRIFPLQGNASGHMYSIGTAMSPKLPDGSIGKYDLIDLDPYGTAAPFLDSAVQALTDGGVLAVTCTDSSTFASVGYLEKTFALYGGLPWKGSQSHEAGLRLIIHAVATSAARYGLSIEPLLSLSIDYYVRIFIRIRKSPAEVKFLPSKTIIVYNCDTGCGAYTTQPHTRVQTREAKNGAPVYHHTASMGPTAEPTCAHCGFKTHIAGPMWGGYLHNPHFVQALIDKLDDLDPECYTTITRLKGMLNTALHETVPIEPSAKDVGQAQQPVETNGNGTGEEAVPATENPRPRIEKLDPVLADPHPFFFIPSELSRVLHITSPSEAALRGAFIGLGYQVSRSHTKPGSIRTNAPWTVIWDVMRAWVHQREPKKVNACKEGTAGFGIWKAERLESLKLLEQSVFSFLGKGNKGRAALAMLKAMKENEDDGDESIAVGGAKEPLIKESGGAMDISEGAKEGAKEGEEAVEPTAKMPQRCMALSAHGKTVPVIFDEKLGHDREKKKFVRYQVNPRENWGPQSRAK